MAETTSRPFGRKAPLVRLIVRRVKPTPGSQLALLVDDAFPVCQAEVRHRL